MNQTTKSLVEAATRHVEAYPGLRRYRYYLLGEEGGLYLSGLRPPVWAAYFRTYSWPLWSSYDEYLSWLISPEGSPAIAMALKDEEAHLCAIHEAGHVVVGRVRCGLTPISIGIKFELMSGQCGGTTQFDPPAPLKLVTNHSSSRLRDQVEQYMCMIAAGGHSTLLEEFTFVRQPLWLKATTYSDRERLRFFASRVSDTPEDKTCRIAYVERARECARQVLEQPQNLFAVEWIAKALLAREGAVTGEEAVALVNEAFAQQTHPELRLAYDLFDSFALGEWCEEDEVNLLRYGKSRLEKAEWLKEVREAAGWTTSQLAVELGISDATYVQFETGEAIMAPEMRQRFDALLEYKETEIPPQER